MARLEIVDCGTDYLGRQLTAARLDGAQIYWYSPNALTASVSRAPHERTITAEEASELTRRLPSCNSDARTTSGARGE